MRQGRPVVDLCIYLGSDVPNKILSHRLPSIPEGYDWDVCTDDALLRLLSARDGRLQAAAGMSYSVLVVERLATLSAEAEAKLAQLKAAGVPVYDARVAGDFALQNFLDSIGLLPDVRFQTANLPEDRLFFAHRCVEASRALAARSLASRALTARSLASRALVSGSNAREDFDIYFFSNHSQRAFNQEIVMRDVAGKVAEYWDPLSGLRHCLPQSDSPDGHLKVALHLAPDESAFIILREPGSSCATISLHAELSEPLPGVASDARSEKTLMLREDWKLQFFLPKDTVTIFMPELCDWTQLADPRLKYHSGSALYEKEINVDSFDNNQSCLLRINGLHAVAKVRVNGKEAGYVWCSPWEIEIAHCLREGKNHLQIEVANQLSNRMIGDLNLPEDERVSFATTPIVKPGDKLLPAGITGSVELIIR